MDPSPLQVALALAPNRPVVAVEKPQQEVFVFRTGPMVFGAPSHHVREVTRIDLVTPLPRAPGFILGAFGHRGEVLPVIDLLRFLNMGELRAAPRSRVFLGLGAQHVVAFLTDAVIGLRRVYVDDIMPRLAGGGTGEFLRGVATARDLGTLHLLDLQRVIAVAREKAVTR